MDKIKIQNYLDKIAININAAAGVVDADGQVFACTKHELLGRVLKFPNDLENDVVVRSGISFVKVREDSQMLCFIEGASKEYEGALSVLAGSIRFFVSIDYEAKKETEYFKGIFFGDYSAEQIVSEAYSLGLEFEATRAVLLVESSKHDLPQIMEALAVLFKHSDDVTVAGVFDNMIALVVNISEQTASEQTGMQIVDTLETELYIKTRVGIGQEVESLAELMRSFESGKTALEVSGVFDTHLRVVNFVKLGIARLINDISEQAGKSFIHEVLDDKVLKEFGNEYLSTVNYFFENSLNVSETARKMFIHRNTLVYRLDKIKKISGLDITRFEDAMVLKLAIMLRRYLQHK